MKTYNDLLAVTPHETTSVRAEVASGVAFIKQRNELTKLTVVLATADDGFQPGDTVWVRGETMKHLYAKEVFENEGLKFILLPKDQVKAIERATRTTVSAAPGVNGRPPRPEPTTVPSAGVPRQDDGARR